MALGISIHIGVNHPRGACSCFSGALKACHADAELMGEIARQAGFEVTALLRGPDATWANVVAALDRAVSRLNGEPDGGILLLSFAGHGCRVWDSSCTEEDCLNESWCLFDQEVLDNDLHKQWARFKSGIRILVVADSCYSGTILSLAAARSSTAFTSVAAVRRQDYARREVFPLRVTTVEDAERIAGARLPLRRSEVEIEASVLLLASCTEWQTSEDRLPNGLFTSVLHRVWNNGRFAGTYLDFIVRIKGEVSTENGSQHPTWAPLGKWTERFVSQKPFTIPPP